MKKQHIALSLCCIALAGCTESATSHTSGTSNRDDSPPSLGAVVRGATRGLRLTAAVANPLAIPHNKPFEIRVEDRASPATDMGGVTVSVYIAKLSAPNELKDPKADPPLVEDLKFYDTVHAIVLNKTATKAGSYTFTAPAPNDSQNLIVAVNRSGVYSISNPLELRTRPVVGHPNRVVDGQYGSDTNDGSPRLPWKTLTKAASSARPGDIVGVRAGTYTEGLHVNVSGQVGKPIVFMAHPDNGSDVVLHGKGVRIVGQSDVEIRGFRIQYCDGASGHDERGIYVQGVAGRTIGNIILANNHTYLTRSSGISVWGMPWQVNPGDFKRINGIEIARNTVERANEGGYNENITVAYGVHNFEIHRNVIKNGLVGTRGGEGITIKEGCAYGRIHQNVIHDLRRRALYIDGGGRSNYSAPTHDIHVYANIAYNVVNGFALMSEGGEDVYNIRVYNNLFHHITEDGAFVYDHPDAASSPGTFRNIQFVNNTMWHCGRNGLDLNSRHLSAASVTNNILSSYRDRFSRATELTNLVGGNPRFTSPDQRFADYRLLPNSSGLDGGSSTDAPNKDLNRRARPAGRSHDIGAYEHH